MTTFKRIDQVKRFSLRERSWPTKSNGHLEVLFALDEKSLHNFLDFSNPEFDTLKVNIRGLRSYIVRGLTKDSLGANEWHRLRTEMVYTVKGSIAWICTDIYGGRVELVLNRNTAVITPPTIMHRYKVLEDDTEIQVIANTLFLPDHRETHDTFGKNSFIKTL